MTINLIHKSLVEIPPGKSATAADYQRIPEVIKAWQVGQLLNARTESGADAQSRVVLRVGQHLLEARTPIALKAGDLVQLSVKSLGLQPVFTILAKHNLNVLAVKKLKSFIAKEGNLKNLLEQLPKFKSSDALSTTTKTLLSSLAQAQATPVQLSQASSLKQFIQQSGYFHESVINKNPINSQPDIKNKLLKLASQVSSEIPKLPIEHKLSNPQLQAQAVEQFIDGKITPLQLARVFSDKLPMAQIQVLIDVLQTGGKLSATANLPRDLMLLVKHLQQPSSGNQPKETLLSILRSLPVLLELQSLIESAIARLTSQQLIPLARDGENPLLWLLEVPVKDKQENNLLQLRIEQEVRGTGEEPGDWSIVIHFDFAAMGLIQARAHMVADTLAIVFHTQNQQTQSFIHQNLPILESSMLKLGFKQLRLDTSSEKISDAKQLPENMRLLDEKA